MAFDVKRANSNSSRELRGTCVGGGGSIDLEMDDGRREKNAMFFWTVGRESSR